MATATVTTKAVSREQLIHSLYEAAELEHNLMCTYLYAAYSLKDGTAEGLTEEEADAVARWRRCIIAVAVEEMGHLTAVWNITSALGGIPRFGRGNFPLDPGALPAGVVVKLAPFNEAVIQHFVFLERPKGSTEPDGEGFHPEYMFTRGYIDRPRLTPMAMDYDTVGVFYETLSERLAQFVEEHGEKVAFAGDPALQLSTAEVTLTGAKAVLCSKTALAAFHAIVEQGEGAPLHTVGSHFQKFVKIRDELAALKEKNPKFSPSHPAAVNPVLRRPMRAEGRVWIEDEEAAKTVDLANTCYAVMLRLIAYSYTLARPNPEKALAVDLALGLMRASTHLAERAARLPAGPSNPTCHAGMSFTALRDAAPFVPGPGARTFFVERLAEMIAAADTLESASDPRVDKAKRQLASLFDRAKRGFEAAAAVPAPVKANAPAAPPPPAPTPVMVDGVERIPGKKLNLLWDGKKCIHSRLCVTGAPNVFLANVQGPWIHPDAMDCELLAGIAHSCPSGAIRYERNDGRPNEGPPLVNLVAVRQNGPYAVRAAIQLDGKEHPFRATLCRCGASKNKPYCDGSHHAIEFDATGEPPTGQVDMLSVRDGVLAVEPELDGPLQVRGNLEITSGTGRAVARVTQARLCRCGGSATKPFCDNTHKRNGFRSENPPPEQPKASS